MKHCVKSAAVAVAATLIAFPAMADVPVLNFSSSAQVYGSIDTSYSSPLLGDVSFTLRGAEDYKYFNSNYSYADATPTGTGVAEVNYLIEAGHGGEGDLVYDIVTNSGEYQFGYSGRAQATGTSLHTEISAQSVDADGNPLDWNANSYLWANAYSSWNQSFYIGADDYHAEGSYGAILVGITLDGSFSSDNNSYGYLSAYSYFSDDAGVNYNNSFSINADSWGGNWTGEKTAFAKLIFQYGTPFTMNLYQSASVSNNGSADFFNTGEISLIEIPFGATLVTGAEQAGLGDAAQLYGNVFQSASLDAENTNWDFGNDGGGYTVPTQPVPEPETYAMMLAGLAVVGRMVRRRR